jgi:hypothetical protein
MKMSGQAKRHLGSGIEVPFIEAENDLISLSVWAGPLGIKQSENDVLVLTGAPQIRNLAGVRLSLLPYPHGYLAASSQARLKGGDKTTHGSVVRLKGGHNIAQGSALGISLPHYSKP